MLEESGGALAYSLPSASDRKHRALDAPATTYNSLFAVSIVFIPRIRQRGHVQGRRRTIRASSPATRSPTLDGDTQASLELTALFPLLTRWTR